VPKAAELQLSQGQEKAVRRIQELALIHDHLKEKARYYIFHFVCLSKETQQEYVKLFTRMSQW